MLRVKFMVVLICLCDVVALDVVAVFLILRT